MHTIPGLPVWLVQPLVALFLAILFLQSGLDKVVDRRGNLDYLTDHFASSPLAGTVRPLLLVITILELTAGVLSALGCVLILLVHSSALAFWGAVVAAVSLTALFFGQRMAKDYAGAAILVPYFLLAIVAMLLLASDPGSMGVALK